MGVMNDAPTRKGRSKQRPYFIGTTMSPKSNRATGRRITSIVARLEDAYTLEDWGPRGDLLNVLIITILSQNTNDSNTDRAYCGLRSAFPDWDAVRRAPESRIARAIQGGGLNQVKAGRIKGLLGAIHRERGELDLEFLHAMSDEEVKDYLGRFKGVGPKTVACLLMFGMGRKVVPVDTHVLRVSKRLGLIGPKVSLEQAHDLLGAQVPPELAYAFHVLLIRHGREVCHARRPRCAGCRIRRSCAFFKEMKSNA